jgi:hypothetical protein
VWEIYDDQVRDYNAQLTTWLDANPDQQGKVQFLDSARSEDPAMLAFHEFERMMKQQKGE